MSKTKKILSRHSQDKEISHDHFL